MRLSEGVLGIVLITQPIANALVIFTRHSKLHLNLESPLLPLFQRRKSRFPLFGKEGLGEILMNLN